MEKTSEILFKPVNSKRNFENISEQIKNLIYSKELAPNDRLPTERELALQFKTGKLAVREALRTLEESGFIYVKSGGEGGIFVKELDASRMTRFLSDMIKVGNIKIQEITEARVIIETAMLESSIKNITKKELIALESNIKHYEKLMNNGKDVNEMMMDGRIKNFHIILSSKSKNQLYRYFLHSLVELSNSYVREFLPGLSLSSKHLNYHKTIYEAVKEKNLKRAKKALRDHLYNVSERFRATLITEK
jgi:GntR family transcriptional repressor for pyruvate dehydrogenase complex